MSQARRRRRRRRRRVSAPDCILSEIAFQSNFDKAFESKHLRLQNGSKR